MMPYTVHTLWSSVFHFALVLFTLADGGKKINFFLTIFGSRPWKWCVLYHCTISIQYTDSAESYMFKVLYLVRIFWVLNWVVFSFYNLWKQRYLHSMFYNDRYATYFGLIMVLDEDGGIGILYWGHVCMNHGTLSTSAT